MLTHLLAIGQISFSHSFGTGMILGRGSGGPVLEYAPRINLVQIGNNLTFSVGTPLAAGAYMTDGDGIYGISLPLMGQINFGAFSNYDCLMDFGGFVGAGYAYSHIDDFTGWYYNKSLGPMYSIGITYEPYDVSYGLRFSLNKNTHEQFLKKAYGDTYTITVFVSIY